MPRANGRNQKRYGTELQRQNCWIVKDIDIQSPTARGGAATLYKMRFSDVRTGLKVEESPKATISPIPVTLSRRGVDFLCR